MAKTNGKKQAAGRQPVQKAAAAPGRVQGAQKAAPARAATEKKEGLGLKAQVLLATGVVVVCWAFLNTCTGNQLTNWDDPGYIRDNALIKDLSGEGIIAIFSTPVMGNYHPLTILTYAAEYSFVRLQPFLYHLDSLLLHLLATLMVYLFVQKLTARPVAATVAALLFGLHPMHMESVAWLAGRKDVLYGSFYMAACYVYLYTFAAVGTRKWIYYGATFLLFAGSILSKPVAVVFPLTLLLLDYYKNGKWTMQDLLLKLPFFAVSFLAGYHSILDQKEFHSLATPDSTAYSYVERLALGGYAFITYLWKAAVPVKLCNFYPYPQKENGVLPALYYLYPVLSVGLLVAVGWFFRKNRLVVFGAGFFIVNIVLLLQFIPVGGAIVADRYSYIPYLGLFVIAGWLVAKLLDDGKHRQVAYAALAATGLYCCWLGYLSNERCKVWYDTTSLWRDEIEKEPHDAPNAWNNLGFCYFNKFNESVNQAERKIYFDSAYYLLSKAIELQPTFANPYISIGELERTIGNFQEARARYYKAISLHSQDGEENAYLGLAIIYAISQNFDSSAYCFRTALSLRYHFPEAHSNFGNFFDMTQHPDSALVQYGIAISQNPDMYAPYLNRGRLLLRLNRVADAMNDFNTSLSLSPDNGEILYARSHGYAQKGDKAHALEDLQQASKDGFTQIDNNYYQSLKR